MTIILSFFLLNYFKKFKKKLYTLFVKSNPINFSVIELPRGIPRWPQFTKQKHTKYKLHNTNIIASTKIVCLASYLIALCTLRLLYVFSTIILLPQTHFGASEQKQHTLHLDQQFSISKLVSPSGYINCKPLCHL